MWNGWMGIPIEYNELNRFDGNYGNPFKDTAADGIHPGPLNNLEYTSKLINHICSYFRNFLPENIYEINKYLL
jgi:hypothetical protein